MSLYECVLIARNDVTQQQVEGIADGIASQLGTDGGTMMKREYWGLRSLAYRIKKNRKGHYMLLGIDAKPAFITEMERQLRLNEDILRFLTHCKPRLFCLCPRSTILLPDHTCFLSVMRRKTPAWVAILGCWQKVWTERERKSLYLILIVRRKSQTPRCRNGMMRRA